MDPQGHPEGDEDVGDVEAGVEVRADGGGEGEGGVEGGAVRGVSWAGLGVEAEGEEVDREEEGKDGEGEGNSAGPVCLSEDPHRTCGEPVHEGGLVEEADAVDVGGDVVVAVEHLPGDLEVDGVNVVEEAGGEEATDLEDEPDEGDEADRAEIGAGDLR